MKTKVPTVFIGVCVGADVVAEEIYSSLERKDLLNLILALDERVAEYDFTEELVKRLTEALAREDEAAKES